jgi:hypothetical protein
MPVGWVSNSMMTTRLFHQSSIFSGNPRGWVSMMTTRSPFSASQQFSLVIGVVGEHGDHVFTLFRLSPTCSGYWGWWVSMATLFRQSPTCSGNPRGRVIMVTMRGHLVPPVSNLGNLLWWWVSNSMMVTLLRQSPI